MAVALLGIGGLLGWLAASLGGNGSPVTTTPAPADGATAVATVPRDPRQQPTVTWTQATVLPQLPAGMEYAGTSGVAELDGRMYVIVNFYDPDHDEIFGHLWQSEDGLEWESTVLDVGIPIAGYELTAIRDTLLMAGRSGDDYALWESVPGRAVGGSSWNQIDLQVPDNLTRSFLATAVNDAGKIVTVLIGELEVWPEIIEPYLPPDVSLDDPALSYVGDQSLYLRDGSGNIQLFAEAPEVVVTGDDIWIRIITIGGEEILRTLELPAGTYPVGSRPTLAEISVAMAWISEDGHDFLPVTGSNALPRGIFMPEAWGDRFVAASYERADSLGTNEEVTLWMSASGRAWQPATQQPPAECSPFFFATSGARMHLTSEEGTQCVRDLGSAWEILDEPGTSTYVIGGPAGFVGYPNSFEYDSAVFSRDGVTWVDIDIPGTEPYPSLSILKERLLTVAAIRPHPDQPTRIDIWVGELN